MKNQKPKLPYIHFIYTHVYILLIAKILMVKDGYIHTFIHTHVRTVGAMQRFVDIVFACGDCICS